MPFHILSVIFLVFSRHLFTEQKILGLDIRNNRNQLRNNNYQLRGGAEFCVKGFRNNSVQAVLRFERESGVASCISPNLYESRPFDTNSYNRPQLTPAGFFPSIPPKEVYAQSLSTELHRHHQLEIQRIRMRQGMQLL